MFTTLLLLFFSIAQNEALESEANLTAGESYPAPNFDNYGYLTIQWAGVIDNGEGDDWPHGKLASLHVLIYPELRYCPGSRKSYSDYLQHVYLNGPSNYEWEDGDAKRMDLCLFRWRSFNDAVTIVVYESDPGGIGRSHDELFCATIRRRGTGDLLVVESHLQAAADAVRNCRWRGITWHEKVWSYGLNRAIPKMFLQFQTQDKCYFNERYSKCPQCKGSGEVICCRGEAFRTCPRCNGSGRY